MHKIEFWTRLGAILVVAAVAGGGLLNAGVAQGEPTPTTVPPTPTPIILPPPVRVTTTVLAVDPPSPVTSGTMSTLTATITSIVSPSVVGTVQFLNGTTKIGDPVSLSDGRTATITAVLPVGTNSLAASFIAGPGFADSTSPAVSYVVNPATAPAATTTRLLAFPAEIRPGDPVITIARVEPAGAAGTVQLRDGTTALGAPVPVVDGVAFAVITELTTVGRHRLTAVFTPTDPAAFTPSTSKKVRVVVRSPACPSRCGS